MLDVYLIGEVHEWVPKLLRNVLGFFPEADRLYVSERLDSFDKYVKSFYSVINDSLRSGKRNVLFHEGCFDLPGLRVILARDGLRHELFNDIVWLDSPELVGDGCNLNVSEVTLSRCNAREALWVYRLNDYLSRVTLGNIYLKVGSDHLRPESRVSKSRLCDSLNRDDLIIHECLMSSSLLDELIARYVKVNR